MTTRMMSTIVSWQDRYLELVKRIEAPLLRSTGRAAEALAEYVPERPHWAVLDEVPSVHELVENQLKFRRRVVDEQAAFVRKLVKAMEPALERIEPRAPAAPVRRVRGKAA